MATITEMFDSRVGAQTGLDGTTAFSLTYRVTTDTVGDNPIAVLADNRIAVNSPIPTPSTVTDPTLAWDSFGVYVRDFVIVDHPAPTTWIVTAICGQLSVADPDRPWDISLTGGLETEVCYYDLDDEPIGPGVYYKGWPEERAEQLKLTNAGYNPDVIYTVKTIKGIVELRRLDPGMGDPYLKGVERTRKVAGITFSRRVPNMTTWTIGAALSRVNKVNSDKFYGAGPGQLKFVGLDARSEAGIMTGQTVENVIWSVSLNMAWNPDGHQPIVVADVWEEDGKEYSIMDREGNRMEKSYKVYEKANFRDLLSLFESS